MASISAAAAAASASSSSTATASAPSQPPPTRPPPSVSTSMRLSDGLGESDTGQGGNGDTSSSDFAMRHHHHQQHHSSSTTGMEVGANAGGGGAAHSSNTTHRGGGAADGSAAAGALGEGASASAAAAASSSADHHQHGGNASSGGGGNAGSHQEQTISYSAERIIGNGSFGVVFQAAVVETGEIVAIKKVLQDKRFKNRELQIMRQLVKDPHSNIVALKHCFYSQGEKADELYLNLVLEFVPETVYSISRQHQKSKIPLPLIFVKLYMYQLSRALAHIHALGICHRDIKPQNLLVDPQTQQLKLCDFGSAKMLVKGEPNVSYICSRYYRAPELIFGSTDYSTAIDIWSEGCVGAELLLGQPLFPGDSGVDQLVEIIKVLGTPTREEISAMNSNYTEFKFPQIKPCQWRKVFRSKTPDEAMDFIASTLAYAPERRIKPLAGCAHPFFDELRDERSRLPSGEKLPPLFDFTAHELGVPPELLEKLLPPHIRAAQSGDSKASGDLKPSAR